MVSGEREENADPCQRAEALLDKGEDDAVVAEMTELLRLAPDRAEAYALRGLAFYYQGQLDRAIADSREAIQRKPLARAYRCRCISLVRKGDHAQAVADGE